MAIRGSLLLDLVTAQRVLPTFFEAEAQQASIDMARNVRARTPVGRIIDPDSGVDLGPSGAARASVQPTDPVQESSTRWRAGAHSDLDYVAILETGARPHLIQAKPGGVLRFWSHGQLFHARSVHHPGFLGFHMFLRGAVDTERGYSRSADMRLQAVLDGIFQP